LEALYMEYVLLLRAACGLQPYIGPSSAPVAGDRLDRGPEAP
jgi:hypothetical protein